MFEPIAAEAGIPGGGRAAEAEGRASSLSATQSKKSAASKIDQLMEQASAALEATKYFDAERAAAQALKMAHEARDYDRMARILLPLQEARRQKRLLAADTGKIIRVTSYEQLEKLGRGGKSAASAMYLVEPPLVGADGRDLRDRLDQLELPAIVVVREPKTRMGLWPVVMIGPATVRTRIKPPKKDKPDAAWMLHAGEALGDEALASVDPGQTADMRVDALLDRLAAVPDHEKLCQALAAACRDAEREAAEEAARPRKPIRKPLDDEDDEFGAPGEDEDEF